jgi:hypothetical protein
MTFDYFSGQTVFFPTAELTPKRKPIFIENEKLRLELAEQGGAGQPEDLPHSESQFYWNLCSGTSKSEITSPTVSGKAI